MNCLVAQSAIILDGEMDEYPENAFFNAGTIEDVRKKAEQMEQNA